jgi:hypothetical protein
MRKGMRATTTLAMMATWAAIACLSGCVSVPPENVSEAIGADELSAHVGFLSQSALEGRKPGSRGSSIARQYIESRFTTYGLVPWGQTRDFAQPFVLGTNVIGVLPGADPNLAKEIVIVCAHYDHLGRTAKGLCPGACDNASGVAALLEIAESLAVAQQRPRRSICFAAFDCEESQMLGSLAFTGRDDFDESKIAGVVNIDMLGRDAFEVLHGYLFVTGTERYPDLRRQVLAHPPDGITLLPIGTELVGPRGDHAAFATLDSPVLFFGCGPHKDYHQPSDTADKLDYEIIEKSARIIAGAVETLADSDTRCLPDLSQDGDIEELKTFRLCLSRIRDGYPAMGWIEAEAQRLDPVIADVDRLLNSEHYTRQDRFRLLRTQSRALLALAAWPELIRDPNDPNKPREITPDESMLVLQTIMMEHQSSLAKAARLIVKNLLAQHPSILAFLLGRTLHATVGVSNVPDHMIFIEPVEPSRYRLEFLSLILLADVRVQGFSRLNMSVTYRMTPVQCMGTEDDLIDCALLLCRRDARRNAYRGWREVLRRATNATTYAGYDPILQARLTRGGWPDEKAWICDRTASPNPDVRRLAIAALPQVMGPHADPMILRVLSDPNAPVQDRQAAISAVDPNSGGEVLMALASLLADRTEIPPDQQYQYDILTHPGTPFESYPLLPLFVKHLKDALQEDAKNPRTISDLACERLQALTRQPLAKDTDAWRHWIEAHWRPRPN